jgi:hypothetical protein
MVDLDHRMADLAVLVDRLPVVAWASYLETWHVMAIFTDISAVSVS